MRIYCMTWGVICLLTLTFCSSLGLFTNVSAQTGRVVWLSEKLDIGVPVEAELTVKVPPGSRVFMADTVLAFSPFELVESKRIDSTISNGELTVRTRFRLLSFRVDSEQELQLVVFYDHPSDTVQALTTNKASISFRPRIDGDPAREPYSFDLKQEPIPEPVDYSHIWIAVGIVLLVLTVLLVALRKPLRRWWLRRKINKIWNRTRADLDGVRSLTDNPPAFIQQLNRIWKEDLQRTESLRNFRWQSLSSTEVPIELKRRPELPSETTHLLAQLMQYEDKIYFGRERPPQTELIRAWNDLLQALENEFNRRKQAVQ